MSAVETASGVVRLRDDDGGTAWVRFGAVMLLLLGSTNTAAGVAAATRSGFFAAPAHYLFGGLGGWGWVIWLIGVAQALRANEATNIKLADAGIELQPIAGQELGRGRGGGHCMTCPVVHDA